MTKVQILLNGKAGTHIPIQDRGLQYGHGLFETIAWRGNVLELWSEHMDRLCKGCARLLLPAPDTELLKTEALSLCYSLDCATIKITITSGESGRGYLTPRPVKPNRIVSCYVSNGSQCYNQLQSIAVTICKTRLATPAIQPGLKHLNRLEQVLAREEWANDEPFKEGLMLDTTGNVVSGTMSNVFFVKNAQIYTNAIQQCGIQGVMRDFIIKLAVGLGVNVISTQFKLQELLVADEIFISNSLIKIQAVEAVNSSGYLAPGPITQKLWEQLQQQLSSVTP